MLGWGGYGRIAPAPPTPLDPTLTSLDTTTPRHAMGLCKLHQTLIAVVIIVLLPGIPCLQCILVAYSARLMMKFDRFIVFHIDKIYSIFHSDAFTMIAHVLNVGLFSYCFDAISFP